MIHEYFGVNLQLVWGVIHKDMPALSAKIRAILESIERGV
jgi:uncharacterized protein with HEPN domain